MLVLPGKRTQFVPYPYPPVFAGTDEDEPVQYFLDGFPQLLFTQILFFVVSLDVVPELGSPFVEV
ncbi:hypothetical protein GF415_01560 [Candidatus Micrarchaeota archaeon]|nr:hypothetical protein [Candidatus Micrarchaeota archaeon]